MITYIIIGVLAVLSCIVITDKKKGLNIAFLLITIFLGIRYMWGSDYSAYLRIFRDTNAYNDFDIFNLGQSEFIVDTNKEYGWAFLNRLAGVSHIGFFGLVLVLTIFECWAVHKMIEKYVPGKYYWVAILTWFFTASSFCVNASMMRQYLCICIYLLVIDMMIERRNKKILILSILIILLATTIHKSSVILLLSLPLFYIKVGNGQRTYTWMVVIGVLFVVWSILGRSLIEPYITLFLEESDDYSQYMRYMNQEHTGGLSTGLGAIFRYLMFATWLIILPTFEKQKQPIVILLIVSYFFDVIGEIAPIAGRLGLYFSFLSMICWAWLFEKAKNSRYLYGLFAIEITVIVTSLPKFFYSDVWMSTFLKYHTIFSAPTWM